MKNASRVALLLSPSGFSLPRMHGAWLHWAPVFPSYHRKVHSTGSYPSQICKTLRVMNRNFRCLRLHLLEQKSFRSECNFDIACITEEFLSTAKKTFIPGFVTIVTTERPVAVVELLLNIKNSQCRISIVDANAVRVGIKHAKGLL